MGPSAEGNGSSCGHWKCSEGRTQSRETLGLVGFLYKEVGGAVREEAEGLRLRHQHARESLDGECVRWRIAEGVELEGIS